MTRRGGRHEPVGLATPGPLRRTLAVAARVLLQLRGDPRFAVGYTVAPVIILVFVDIVFDALDIPKPVQQRFAVLGVSYVIHFVAFLLTALVVVGERIEGTLQRMFVNGYRRSDILGGYVLSYTGYATIQSAVVLAVATRLFDLEYGFADLAEIFLVLWLLAILMMALGMLASAAARTQAQVIPFVPAIVLPGMFLSGIVVAVDKLPGWAQVLSRVTPLYYSTEVLEGFLATGSVFDEPARLAILPVFAVAVLVLAGLTLREER